MSDKEKKGLHEWLIEFEKEPVDLDAFTDSLDQKLQELNSDYEAKRFKSTTLEKPRIVVLERGTFLQWMREKGKVGGQHKVPRLANNREYLDELLALRMKNEK